jgi:arsenical-resistance protein 2
MAEVSQKEEPWWASFPEPKAACDRIEASKVKDMVLAQNEAGRGAAKDFLLVDVRRTDYEGGTIATSINLPAQSFYQTRPATYQLCKQAGIKKIIFYCGEHF